MSGTRWVDSRDWEMEEIMEREARPVLSYAKRMEREWVGQYVRGGRGGTELRESGGGTHRPKAVV